MDCDGHQGRQLLIPESAPIQRPVGFRVVILIPVYRDWQSAAPICRSVDEQLGSVAGRRRGGTIRRSRHPAFLRACPRTARRARLDIQAFVAGQAAAQQALNREPRIGGEIYDCVPRICSGSRRGPTYTPGWGCPGSPRCAPTGGGRSWSSTAGTPSFRGSPRESRSTSDRNC